MANINYYKKVRVNMAYTPLRYPGGKSKLYDLFTLILSNNFTYSASYAEPYAGGSGLALSLLLKEKVKEIYINDINKSIYAFWYCVLYETDMFVEKILETTVNLDEWHKQKEIQLHKDEVELLDLGFSTFFLNRTNRSGILRGGIIGGKKQDGTWKLDARFNKTELIKRIEVIAEKKEHIHLSNKDACDFLDDMDSIKIRNLFYYLDPPYIKKGSGLYENFYTEVDHRMLSKRVSKLKNKWVVSYDEHDLAMELYGKYNKMTYDLNYSAQEIKKGREFMAFSHRLQLPCELTESKPEDKVFGISNVFFTNISK